MSPTPAPPDPSAAEERIREVIAAVRDAPNTDAFAGTSPSRMLDRLLAEAYSTDPWTLTLDLRLLIGALVLITLTAVATVYITNSARANRDRADYELQRAYDAYDRRRAHLAAERDRAAEREPFTFTTLPPAPPAPPATED